jgi:hypothetical protein
MFWQGDGYYYDDAPFALGPADGADAGTSAELSVLSPPDSDSVSKDE